MHNFSYFLLACGLTFMTLLLAIIIKLEIEIFCLEIQIEDRQKKRREAEIMETLSTICLCLERMNPRTSGTMPYIFLKRHSQELDELARELRIEVEKTKEQGCKRRQKWKS